MALVPPPNNDPLSSPGPFEGPEKLLEVWFAPSPDALPVSSSSSTKPGRRGNEGQEYRGLRNVPREVWEEMLDIVKCKVLSVVEGDEIDAYLLR
jgi:S-adenosylmethionine decarboxylase